MGDLLLVDRFRPPAPAHVPGQRDMSKAPVGMACHSPFTS